MSAKRYSLRRRLIATTVGSSVAVGLISTGIVLAIAWKEVGDAFDDTLEEGSRIVLALGDGALRGPAAPSSGDDRGARELKLDYQIVAGDGTVLLRGNDAPNRAFVDPGDFKGKSRHFHDVYQDDRWWRVHVRTDPARGRSVQVGQKWKERSELIGDVLESLAWPLAVLWALLAGANWWLVRRQLTPLERLAQGMEAKSPDDLAPVVDTSRAHEVHSVVGALNRLLERLSRALEGERRFTADAAHELRTPLAALASRIQLMQRSHAAQVPQSSQLAADLQRLRDDVARSTSMVDKLLQLARLDPQSTDAVAMRAIDLRELLDEVVQACAASATARRVGVSVECHADAVLGHHEWLFSALRNLVDNAIRYGAEGGRVQVSAVRSGTTVEVAVRDDGPGVSGEALGLLTQRFYRVLGTGAQGSGLGLSIVARVAELHGAALQLGEGLDGRGLGVVISLRAAPSDSLHVGPVQ